MSAGARRGASPAVVRAIAHSGAQTARSSESATCPLCKGVLRFFSGEFGQTLEQCDTVQCVNRLPHHPQPDPNATAPRFREPKRRAKRGARGEVPGELRGGLA